MNISKIQRTILNRMLSNESVRIEKTTKDVFVTTNGFWAARIPLKNVCFNLDKCTDFNHLIDFFEIKENDVPLKCTKIMKKASNGILLKFVSETNNSKTENFEVWIEKKLLDICGEINLLGSSPINPVKLKNLVTGQIDAIVMPTRNVSGMEND